MLSFLKKPLERKLILPAYEQKHLPPASHMCFHQITNFMYPTYSFGYKQDLFPAWKYHDYFLIYRVLGNSTNKIITIKAIPAEQIQRSALEFLVT